MIVVITKTQPTKECESCERFIMGKCVIGASDDLPSSCLLADLTRKNADVVERKVCHNTGESRVFRCSNCGYGVDDIFEDKDAPVYLFERFEYWHYCPNCGADMREER